MKLSWLDARGECELMGGWLVQIKGFLEYNCLMRHGFKEETQTWYWTDGNDDDGTGVWTHAHDGTDVTYFPPRVSCGCNHCTNSDSGDAFILYLGADPIYRER